MKKLKDILYRVAVESVFGSTDIDINTIVFDSRKIIDNDVFVAIRGTIIDGHEFISSVIESGAKAIICEDVPKKLEKNIAYIIVKDTKAALAIMADNFYDNPSNSLKLIGITGTNGKTTIASLLFSLFKKAGYKVGLMSTVKILVNDNEFKATHTTPDSISINYYLRLMVDSGVTHCFMEVSSHGIHQ